jgi:hypothetical protein
LVVLLSAESFFELFLNVIFLGEDLYKTHDFTSLTEDSSLVLSHNDGKSVDLGLVIGSFLLHCLLHTEDFVILGSSDFLAILDKSINLRRVRSV